MSLLIKNGRIIDPANKVDCISDLLIEKGKVAKIESQIKLQDVTKVIEAKDKIVIPGLIDMHTHLRQPGRDDEETILSGSRAAVKGGFTTILCMANTSPVIDNASVVRWIIKEAESVGLLNIIPVGAVTKGLEGKELAELGELKDAGCLAISDDGRPVKNAQLMRRALEYAKMLGLLLISHCEDVDLSQDGLADESLISTVSGLGGIPQIAETIFVAREIELARFLNAKIHLAHITTQRSVELIQRAKKEGISITAETCPHYFTLTHEAIREFDTNTKVNPPLRSKEDVEAIKKGLSEGIIDCIATDHAPHNQAEKELEFYAAPSGIIGLETALSLAIGELLDNKVMTWPELVRKMSSTPVSCGTGRRIRCTRGATTASPSFARTSTAFPRISIAAFPGTSRRPSPCGLARHWRWNNERSVQGLQKPARLLHHVLRERHGSRGL